MTYDWKNKSSFLFGGIDMYQRFGISIVDDGMPKDVLFPQLRSRKVTIPLRDGSYDYGAEYYDERPIPYTCVTVKAGTRDDAREMAYILSKKSEIRFWYEQDKYYVGRVYQAPDLEVLRNVGNRFTLTFIMEPFAYGESLTRNFTGLHYEPEYIGTAPTPTRIIIRNTGAINAQNIKIIQSIKKGE